MITWNFDKSSSDFSLANWPYLFQQAPKTIPSSVLMIVCLIPAVTWIAQYCDSSSSSDFGKSITIGVANTDAHFSRLVNFPPFLSSTWMVLYNGKPSWPLTFQPQT